MSTTDTAALAELITEALGPGRLVQGQRELGQLTRDMGTPPPVFERLLRCHPPSLALRPRSAAELARAVGLLSREGVAFTTRGLGSSGLGGAVPVSEGVVLDLSGLTGVLALDTARRRVHVAAGTSFFHLQRALDPHGLSLRSRPSNAFGSIGGWAACGGLGLGSLRAGPVAEQVTALDLVLPDGGQERLTPGDPGFPDFFDTEGQLGVIGALELQLGPSDRACAVAGLSFPDLSSAMDHLASIAQGDGRPLTALLVGRGREQHGLECPPDRELMLLQLPAGQAPTQASRGVEMLPAELTARLWQRRFFPMDGPLGPIFLASESLLAMNRVAPYVAGARRLAARYGVPLHVHCHAVATGGSPRVLVLQLFPVDPGQPSRHLLLTPLAAVLTARARQAGGVPYGVGIWNTPFARDRFGERFEQLRARKNTLDPRGLLNPGKFFQVGVDAKLLPALMNPTLYPTSLSAAALASPLILPREAESQDAASTPARCIRCGSCATVCPAVTATGEETLSARAKLGLLQRLQQGEEPPETELLAALRCLDCGQCAEVCARGLDLLAAWQDLEQEARQRCTDPGALADSLLGFAEQVDTAATPVRERGLS